MRIEREDPVMAPLSLGSNIWRSHLRSRKASDAVERALKEPEYFKGCFRLLKGHSRKSEGAARAPR